jgi:hypothetical protein
MTIRPRCRERAWAPLRVLVLMVAQEFQLYYKTGCMTSGKHLCKFRMIVFVL